MALYRIGAAGVDLSLVAYIEDTAESSQPQDRGNASVVIHFKDSRELILYGKDAAAARAYVATLPKG